MNVLKFSLIALCWLQGFAHAATDGGGGGGFCINDRCYTAAEAGFRVNSGEKIGYILTNELLDEVQSLLEMLPLSTSIRDQLLEEIGGDSQTYRKVVSVEKGKYRSLVYSYKKIFQASDYRFKSQTFELFAFSTGSNTYLLPKFFSLDLQQQAKILIHELIVRLSPNESGVLNALKLDGYIQDLAENRKVNFGELAWLLSATFKLDGSEVLRTVFISLERELGKPIPILKYLTSSPGVYQVSFKRTNKSVGYENWTTTTEGDWVILTDLKPLRNLALVNSRYYELIESLKGQYPSAISFDPRMKNVIGSFQDQPDFNNNLTYVDLCKKNVGSPILTNIEDSTLLIVCSLDGAYRAFTHSGNGRWMARFDLRKNAHQ